MARALKSTSATNRALRFIDETKPVARRQQKPAYLIKEHMKDMKNKQAGFSLIVLLIVVAIIGIIAAIAIPNLLASRRAANEGSAQSSLRTIHSAEATYQATAGNGQYGTLAQLMNQNLVDGTLGSGTKSGYTFSLPAANLDAGPPPTFWVSAVPANVAAVTRTGNRSFCVSEDGVMHGAVQDAIADRAACLNLGVLGN